MNKPEVTGIGTIKIKGDSITFDGFTLQCHGHVHSDVDHALLMLDAFYTRAKEIILEQKPGSIEVGA